MCNKGFKSVSDQFRVFNFPDALVADLGQPLLEGFGSGGADGLDDAENTCGISAVDFLSSAKYVRRICFS